MRGRAVRWRWVSAGGGAIFAVVALVAALAWPTIFDSVLSSQVALAPGSRSYREWVAPTVPLYFDIFLFNWTNAADFPEQIPKLEQLGPYRFRESRRHVNVSWHEHNGSVSYRTLRSWQFDAAGSNATLQDNITTLNVIAASAIYRSRDWGFLRQKGLSMGLAMFGQQIAVSKLASELLFDGYEDPLLDLAKSLPASTTGGAPPVDRFGWFYQRNNSIDTDGYLEVSSGIRSGSLPGQILKWNHLDHLPYYSGECSKLSGSVGEFFQRNLSSLPVLPVFLPDLCRTVQLEFSQDGQHGGLPYRKYHVAESSFDNSSLTSSNACFCNGECGWSGVMNVSACRFGSPAFITLPHFLHADSTLHTLVEGLDPDPKKHSFYFAIEPKLGVPLDVAARFQLNIFMEPSENIALYENVPKMLFPILWVEQRVLIEDRVLVELQYVRSILDWGATVCASIAIFFTSLVAIATCCFKKSPYSSPLDLQTITEKPRDEAEVKLNPL